MLYMKELDFTEQIKAELLKQEGNEENISEESWAAEQKTGKKLNKPFRTPGGPKKFSVYVKNDKGNVVKVNFGDPNMSIKRDDPARRKSFRARHGCDNPGPKTKAKYWSCKMWSKKSVTKMTKGADSLEEEMVEFLDESEASRPGRKSAAQTPAKPSEKKKGSSKNKAGSAGQKGSKITFSEKVVNALKQKVTDHNKKHPSKKVTLGQLKKIYRRGAGAFSTSHRPGMSRGGWAMARVNMFLKMKRGGKVKDSYRKADQDVAKASSAYLEDDGDWGITAEEHIEVDLDIKKFDLFEESEEELDVIFQDDSEAVLSEKQKKLPPALQKAIMKKKGGKTEDKSKDKKEEPEKDSDKKKKSEASHAQGNYVFDNPGEAMKAAKKLGLNGIHEHKEKGKTIFMPGKSHEELEKKMKEGSEAGHAPGHKKGLWENIRDKKRRMGKNYKPAKPGDKDRPSKEALEKAQKASKK